MWKVSPARGPGRFAALMPMYRALYSTMEVERNDVQEILVQSESVPAFGFVEKSAVRQDVRAYFEERVIPLIAREHPEMVSEMSIRVAGSVGLGLNDERSDLDATLFLPKALWKKRGDSYS